MKERDRAEPASAPAPSRIPSLAVDWLGVAMHAGLATLAALSAARYAIRHGFADSSWRVFALTIVVVVVDLAALFVRDFTRYGAAWLTTVCVAWTALVLVAPSFIWCAFPLAFMCLRVLSLRVAAVAVLGVSIACVVGLLRISDRLDPSLFAGPLVVAGLTVITYDALARETKARQRVIEELVATRDELADRQRRAGALEERARLASEVHDTVAQGLSSVLLLTQAAAREIDDDGAQARRHLDRAIAQVRHDLDEVRRIVHALGPPALDGASLAAALRDLCARAAAESGTDVRFHIVDDPVATSPAHDAVLFRIAQEALANAIAHGGPRRIDVTVSYLSDAVTLDVVDDGCGFDLAVTGTVDPTRGYGLRGMRLRASQLGGTLTIETSSDAGTAVAVTLPVVPPLTADGNGHGG